MNVLNDKPSLVFAEFESLLEVCEVELVVRLVVCLFQLLSLLIVV
jgi:hypothetical protein